MRATINFTRHRVQLIVVGVLCALLTLVATTHQLAAAESTKPTAKSKAAASRVKTRPGGPDGSSCKPGDAFWVQMTADGMRGGDMSLIELTREIVADPDDPDGPPLVQFSVRRRTSDVVLCRGLYYSSYLDEEKVFHNNPPVFFDLGNRDGFTQVKTWDYLTVRVSARLKR